MDGSLTVNGHSNRCPVFGDTADPRRCFSCGRVVEVHGHLNDAYVWCSPGQERKGTPVGVTTIE